MPAPLTAGYSFGVGALFVGLSLIYALADALVYHGSREVGSPELIFYAAVSSLAAGCLFWLGRALFRRPKTGEGAISSGAGCAFVQLLIVLLLSTWLPIVACLLLTAVIHLLAPLMWHG